METVSPAGSPVLMSWLVTVGSLSCTRPSPVAQSHQSARTYAQEDTSATTQCFTTVTVKRSVHLALTLLKNGAWESTSNVATSHVICKTSLVAWYVVKRCHVKCTAANGSATGASVWQKAAASSPARYLVQTVATRVLLPVIKAAAAHAPPAPPRWLCSVIVGEERKRWSAQRQPLRIRGMQPSPWPANCLTCSSVTRWTSAHSSLRRS